MNLQRKHELAKQSIASISQHDDADSVARRAVLNSLREFLDSEEADMDARAKVKADEALTPTKEA